jgi:hypothetical protein
MLAFSMSEEKYSSDKLFEPGLLSLFQTRFEIERIKKIVEAEKERAAELYLLYWEIYEIVQLRQDRELLSLGKRMVKETQKGLWLVNDYKIKQYIKEVREIKKELKNGNYAFARLMMSEFIHTLNN